MHHESSGDLDSKAEQWKFAGEPWLPLALRSSEDAARRFAVSSVLSGGLGTRKDAGVSSGLRWSEPCDADFGAFLPPL